MVVHFVDIDGSFYHYCLTFICFMFYIYFEMMMHSVLYIVSILQSKNEKQNILHFRKSSKIQ
jgi:hypothetical protein